MPFCGASTAVSAGMSGCVAGTRCDCGYDAFQ